MRYDPNSILDLFWPEVSSTLFQRYLLHSSLRSRLFWPSPDIARIEISEEGQGGLSLKGSNYFSISRRSTRCRKNPSTPTILAQNPLFCASHEFLQNSTLGWSRLHICNPHPMESDHEQGRQGINIWSGESHRNTKDLKTNNPKIPARRTIQPWDFVPDVCPHTSNRPL